MKITKSRLNEIITEEIQSFNQKKLLKEEPTNESDLFLTHAIRSLAKEMGGIKDLESLKELKKELNSKLDKSLKKLLKVGDKVNLQELLRKKGV